jgi:hypothetical protein
MKVPAGHRNIRRGGYSTERAGLRKQGVTARRRSGEKLWEQTQRRCVPAAERSRKQRQVGGGGGSRTRVRKSRRPGVYMLSFPFDLVRRLPGKRETIAGPVTIWLSGSRRDGPRSLSHESALDPSGMRNPPGAGCVFTQPVLDRCSHLRLSSLLRATHLGMQPRRRLIPVETGTPPLVNERLSAQQDAEGRDSGSGVGSGVRIR